MKACLESCGVVFTLSLRYGKKLLHLTERSGESRGATEMRKEEEETGRRSKRILYKEEKISLEH